MSIGKRSTLAKILGAAAPQPLPHPPSRFLPACIKSICASFKILSINYEKGLEKDTEVM